MRILVHFCSHNNINFFHLKYLCQFLRRVFQSYNAQKTTCHSIQRDQNVFDSINNKLILSTGSDGVLVYNWDGNSFNIYEEMRLYSSYAFTARIINDVYYVATKNGLEIYNIGD